jgi:hypothetical protein
MRRSLALIICSLLAGFLLILGTIAAWLWANSTRSADMSQVMQGRRMVYGLRAPLPEGASGGILDSVACPSPSTCVGLGSYSDRSHRFPILVMTGTGSQWHAIAVSLPNHASSVGPDPLAMACPAPSRCVGVGAYFARSPANTEGLIVTSSGSTWSAMHAPLPSNASTTPSAALNAVACASATVCTATGSYTTTDQYAAGLLITRAGTAWHAFEVTASLKAVACASSSMCIVAGSYIDGKGADQSEGILLAGTGSSWTAVRAPLPPNAARNPGAALESVTCPTANMCTAAGYYTDTSGHQDGLVVIGAGTSWAATEVADSGALLHVACTSPLSCVAVGNSEPVLATGSGSSWRTISAPLPENAERTSSSLSFYSATCHRKTICAITGMYDTISGEQEGLLIYGSGTSWTASEAPLPPSARGNSTASLEAGACPLPTQCVAAGSYNNDINSQPFIVTTVSTGPASGHPGQGPAVPNSSATEGHITQPAPGLTAKPPAHGVYEMNRQISRDKAWVLSLRSIKVSSGGKITFFVTYENTTSAPARLYCSGDTNPSVTTLTLANGNVVRASATFCSEHPNRTIKVASGQSFTSYAVFPSIQGFKKITFFWYAGILSGTVSTLTLSR